MLCLRVPHALRSPAILLLAGFNLSIVQFVMIRELTAALRGVEIVILLVSASFFAGFSLGYLIADRLRDSWLVPLGMATLILHLCLPLVYRYGGGWLAAANARPAFFVGGLAVAPFVVSSFYSVFLPRGVKELPLAAAYATELAGTALGIGALVALAGLGPAVLLAAYTAAFLALLALLGTRRVLLAALGTAAAIYLFFYPALDLHSAAYFYRNLRAFSETKSLAVRYSPYQRVDVIEANGRKQLYLDGLIHYGDQALSYFNIYLASLPARLVKPERAVIVGSGSMASVSYVAPYAGAVTTVELDPQVIAVSREFFADVNRLDEFSNWTLVIADGKQFLAASESQYDLIVMDVTVPLTIQTAALHSVEFYELARQRLTPGGVISISLNGEFAPENPTPMAVAAAAAQVFDDFYIITSGESGRSFLYAGPGLPFAADELRSELAAWNMNDYTIHTAADARAVIGNTAPIRADDLRLVWTRSWAAVLRWWFGG